MSPGEILRPLRIEPFYPVERWVVFTAYCDILSRETRPKTCSANAISQGRVSLDTRGRPGFSFPGVPGRIGGMNQRLRAPSPWAIKPAPAAMKALSIPPTT